MLLENHWKTSQTSPLIHWNLKLLVHWRTWQLNYQKSSYIIIWVVDNFHEQSARSLSGKELPSLECFKVSVPGDPLVVKALSAQPLGQILWIVEALQRLMGGGFMVFGWSKFLTLVWVKHDRVLLICLTKGICTHSLTFWNHGDSKRTASNDGECTDFSESPWTVDIPIQYHEITQLD